MTLIALTPLLVALIQQLNTNTAPVEIYQNTWNIPKHMEAAGGTNFFRKNRAVWRCEISL
jgi:hypothetical protein